MNSTGFTPLHPHNDVRTLFGEKSRAPTNDSPAHPKKAFGRVSRSSPLERRSTWRVLLEHSRRRVSKRPCTAECYCCGYRLPRHHVGIAVARRVMTTLDERLYAWLCEPDDRRFTLAFNSYFLVAFPAVIRHLARFAPADPALLEEIAQDSLLKFFEHIGQGRREASRAIEEALGEIRPVSLGSLHEGQVCAWRADVDSYRRSTMGFRLAPGASDAALAWKNTIRELTLQIPTLQRQGWQLIDAVRIALQWHELDDADAFTRAVMHSAPSANTVEIRLPGTTQLVYRAVTIIRAIPRLQVPTNGYLFEISYTIYLDDYRKRRRHKRGGPGSRSGDDVVYRDSGGARTLHPLEDQRLEDAMDEAEAADLVPSSGSPGTRFTPDNDSTASDPIRRLEDQQYFERFYSYLRAPVAAAEAAYDAARAYGAATAERRKWDSLRQKLSRSVAILAAIGEGYTQEQTAQRLRLTRNQVKYVIETLQDAYARFAAQSSRSSYPRTTGGVPCHGK